MKQKSLYRLTAAVEKKEFFFFFGDQQPGEMYKKRFCGKLLAAKVELSHGIAAFRKEGRGQARNKTALPSTTKSLAPALDSDLTMLDETTLDKRLFPFFLRADSPAR